MVRPHPRVYACLRAETTPPMDGWLDHPEWVRAPWSQEFVDIEGPPLDPQSASGAGRPSHGPIAPRLKTRMKMLWDEHGLYIGAEMEEPDLWATLTERDSVIFRDHDFEVFLDPDDDHHQYIELEINALNTVWDLLLPKPYRDGGEALNGFNLVGLKTAVALKGSLNDPSKKDEGWSVAIFMPWSAIAPVSTKPVPPRVGDRWRINFSRVEWDLEVVHGKPKPSEGGAGKIGDPQTAPTPTLPGKAGEGAYRKIPNRPEHNWVWSPQWVVNMHCPEMWGFVEFVTEATWLGRPALGASDSQFGSTGAGRPSHLDAHWEERCQLIAVYEGQVAYQKAHGKCAPTAAALGLDFAFRLIPGERQWLAEIVKGGTRLAIREDSRLSILPDRWL